MVVGSRTSRLGSIAGVAVLLLPLAAGAAPPCAVTAMPDLSLGGRIEGVAGTLGPALVASVVTPSGGALMRTDGLAASSVVLAELPSVPWTQDAIADRGRLLVRMRQRPNGTDSMLWRTDGTAAGTVAVVADVPGPPGLPSLVVRGRQTLVALAGNVTAVWSLPARGASARHVGDVPSGTSPEGYLDRFVGHGRSAFFLSYDAAWFVGRRGAARDVLRWPTTAVPPQSDWVATTPRGVFVATHDEANARWDVWLLKGTRARRVGSHPASGLPDAQGERGGIETLIPTGGRRIFYTAADETGAWSLWTTRGGRSRWIAATPLPPDCHTSAQHHRTFCENRGLSPRIVIDERLYLVRDGAQERTTASGKATEPSALPALPPSLEREPVSVAGRVLFRSAYQGNAPVWQSDGTPEGTVPVAAWRDGQRSIVGASDRAFVLSDDSVEAFVLDCPRP